MNRPLELSSETIFEMLTFTLSGQPTELNGTLLGIGSFGKVYRVQYPDQELAVKVNSIVEVEKELSIFKKTASCPNIVKFDCVVFYPDASIAHLAMEYVPYPNLFQQLNLDHDLNWVRNMARSVLNALKWLHSRNMIHADIKSTNILADPTTGMSIICDLGSVLITPNPQEGIVCALSYRPLEVILRMQWFKPIDIWGIGVCLWEAATRLRLIPITADDELLASHCLRTRFGSLPKGMTTTSLRIDLLTQAGCLKPSTSSIGLSHWKSHLPKDRLLKNLISKMLKLEPENRISAHDALQHPFLA